MVCFVIAGIYDCADYIHVCHVADYLRKKLPNVEIQKVPMDGYDWGVSRINEEQNWLDTINMKNKWHHTRSPLIYKELRGFGKDPHLIGGISEFWEYCFDYYGLESVLSREELENLRRDHLIFYGKDHLVKDPKEGYMHILIYGPKTRYLWLLLEELFQIKGLSKTGGFKFNFYTDSANDLREPENDFQDVVSYLQSEHNMDSSVWETLVEAVEGSELIIITEHFCEHPEKGLKPLIITMNQLADLINCSSKPMKVIFANFGLSCFPATILAGKLDHPNIVVVTSDKGLGPLNVLSRKLNLDVGKLSGPPVWGFIGNNKVIDLCGIVKKCDVYKPFARAVKAKEDSSLALGTVDTEMRFIDYLIDDLRGIWMEIRKTKSALKEKLQYSPIYSKLSATVNLLNLWFSSDEPDEIISLGVISDGSYNIPAGIVFSQPAVLQNGKWAPFPNFPVGPEIKTRIDKSVEDALKLIV